MGYSIGIRAKNKTGHQAMLDFMGAQYRSWPTITGGGNAYSSPPSDDLSYDHGKLTLGLDYGCLSGWEREYAYALTRWMAIRVGRTRSTFPGLDPKLPTFAKPVPYMVYDGYEVWPILVGTSAQSKKRSRKTWWCCTDSLGLHNSPEADCEYINHVIFSSKDFIQLHNDTVEKFGGWPDEGRHEWRDKVFLDMLKDPKLKAAVDAAVKPIRDELQRLVNAWQAR